MDKSGVIAKYVQERIKRWDSDLSEKRKDWERYYRTWQCKSSPQDKTRASELSQIKMPNTKLAIDTAYDQLQEMTFARSPFFEIRGREEADKVPAKMLEAYMEYLFNKQGFITEYGKMSRERLILGTSIGIVDVEQQKRHHETIEKVPRAPTPITEEMQYDEMGNMMMEELPSDSFTEPEVIQELRVEETTISVPKARHISIFDFYIDPTATCIEDAEGVGIRYFKSVHALRKLEDEGIIGNVEQVEDVASGDIGDERRSRLADMGISVSSSDANRVELYEYWGWIDEDTLKEANFNGQIEHGGAEVRAICAYDATLLIIANPHVTKRRPFVRMVYQEIPGEFFGLGIAEAVDSAQRAIDSTVRARIDSKAFTNFPMFGMDVTKIVSQQDKKIYPGKIWYTKGPVQESIQQLPTRDTSAGSQADVSEYGQYVQEGSGISKLLGGLPVKRGEQSATEASILNSQSSVRLKSVAREDEYKTVTEILRWYYHIILQYLDVPEIIKVRGMEGTEILAQISPESVVGDYDFIPNGTTEIAQRAEVERMFQILQMAMGSPIGGQMINIQYLVTKIFQRLFPHASDEDKLFRPAPAQQNAIRNAGQMPRTGSAPKPPAGPNIPPV